EHQSVITWSGGGNDQHRINPRNWKGGRVPGATDIARFTAHSKSGVIVDTHLAGGLKLESGFHGAVKLNSDLALSGDMVIHAGRVKLRDHSLRAAHYRQAGGNFRGEKGALIVERD